MNVRAKMRVTSITQSGDAKKPYVQVQLGAVYSSDPESENRSFANATPTAELKMSIDAGRPAARAFELQQEFYVDLTPIGIPERTYLGDYGFVDGNVIVESRDKSASKKVGYVSNRGQLIELDGTPTSVEKLKAEGFEFWRHPKDGE